MLAALNSGKGLPPRSRYWRVERLEEMLRREGAKGATNEGETGLSSMEILIIASNAELRKLALI